MKFIVLALTLLFSNLVFSQSDSFRCNFSDGFLTTWTDGKKQSERGGRMTELISMLKYIQK